MNVDDSNSRKTRYKRRKNLVDKLFRLAGGKRRKKTRKKRGGECRTGESNWDCQKRLRKEKQQQFAYDRVMKSEYNKKKASELQSEINAAESVPIEKISIPKMRKSNYLKGQKKRHFPAQYLHQLDLGKYKGGRRRKKRGGNTLPCPFCDKGNFKNIPELKVHLEDPANKKCKEKYLNFDLRLGERGGNAASILAEMKNDTNMTINNNMSDEDYEKIKIIIDKLSKNLQKGGRRKRRKKTRKKRGGYSFNDKEIRMGGREATVMELVDIFYKPPASVKPAPTSNGLGQKNWESQWSTLSNALKCYLGNMEKHKMDRKNYIKNGKGFLMNKKKRKASWDACKHKKGPDHRFAIQYFMKEGFDDPTYVELTRPKLEAIMMTKLPTIEALMAKLKEIKYWHDIKQKRHAEEAIAKTKFGGKTRRRKRSRKRKRTRRRKKRRKKK